MKRQKPALLLLSVFAAAAFWPVVAAGAVTVAGASTPSTAAASPIHTDRGGENFKDHDVDEDTGKIELRSHGGGAGKRGGAREEQLEELFDEVEDALTKPWHERDLLSGAWFGARSSLERIGLEIVPAFVGESVHGLRGVGARRSAASYVAEAMVAFSGEHLGAKGLRVVGIGHMLGGGGLTEQGLGDVQVLSNIDAPTRQQWSELWVQLHLLKDKLTLKLGKMDANVDFAALEMAAELINSSFGLPPTIALPTYPDPGWGALVVVQPNKTLQFDLGWFEGAADGASFALRRRSLVDDAVALAEVTVHTGPLFDRPHGGSQHVGVWTRTSQRAGLAQQDRSRAGGLWWMAEEPVWTHDDDLVALFCQASWRWAVTAVDIRRTLTAGVVMQGVVPWRPDDLVSLAFASATVEAGSETSVELFYKVAVLGAISVVVDLQYIHQPAGVLGKTGLVGLSRLSVQL